MREVYLPVSTVYHAVGTHGICVLAAQVVDSAWHEGYANLNQQLGVLIVSAHLTLCRPVAQTDIILMRPVNIISTADYSANKTAFSVADCDFDEYDKPGAERSRRRRGEDDDLER